MVHDKRLFLPLLFSTGGGGIRWGREECDSNTLF